MDGSTSPALSCLATASAASAAASVAVSEGVLSAVARVVKNVQRPGGALAGLKTGNPELGQTIMPASKSSCILDQSAVREGGRRSSASISGVSERAILARASRPSSVAKAYFVRHHEKSTRSVWLPISRSRMEAKVWTATMSLASPFPSVPNGL